MRGYLILLGVSVLVLLSLPFTAHASSVSSEKLHAYANLYPQLFRPSSQSVANKLPTNGKPQAVALLLRSFNGNTDVSALSAVLKSGDQSPMKTDAEIKELLVSRGLSWEDYTDITHALATEPETFELFFQQLDKNRIQQNIAAQSHTPGFIRQINSIDHQMIVQNLMNYKP